MQPNKTQCACRKSESGFTLVETLVAISILMITVLGPMSIAAKGLQNAYIANDRITAVYLAQEATESIRKLRDDKGLDAYLNTGAAWDWYDEPGAGNPIHHCKAGGGGDGKCDFDVYAGDYTRCNGPNACRLDYDPDASNGYYYLYDPGSSLDPSPFTREIVLTEPTQGVVLVTVTVTWDSPHLSADATKIVLRSWLYDQYNRLES